MNRSLTRARTLVLLLLFGAAASDAFGQAASGIPDGLIPPGATVIEGTPSVRIDTTEERTSRRVLSDAERGDSRLRIRIRDGRLYWASRDDRPLAPHTDGEFTYLAAEPGHYIRLRRLGDRIAYVEHLEQGRGIVTYWGEIRLGLGKR